MGPLGGLCLGFCTDYRYKTAMNCFGALMLGAGIYGIQGAVILRIVDTVLGVAFAFLKDRNLIRRQKTFPAGLAGIQEIAAYR